MSKRITAFLISLCFFILMTTPMAALAAEEIPTADTAETVSGNDLREPGESQADPGTPEETSWIRVLKTDTDTGAPLPGAFFKVYHAADGTEAGELLTGSGGTGQAAIAPGDYYLLEQCAPEGYELSAEKYAFTVAGGETKDLTVANKPLPAPEPAVLKITKTDADQNDRLLSGAVFSVYEEESGRKAGELMTGKDGTAGMELPAGSYTMKETMAPEGYLLSSNVIHVSLQEGEVKELTVTNRKGEETEDSKEPGALRITKRDSESGERLKDAIFGIYETDTDNCMGEVTTDQKGVAEIELKPGSYYLLELEAPEGYRLDEEKIGFRVRSGKTTEKNVKNVKEEEKEEQKENSDKEPDEQTSPFDSLFSALSSVPFSDTSSAAGSSSTWTGSGESRDTADKKTGTLQVVNSAAGTGEKLSGQVLSVYNSDGKKAGEVTVKNGRGTLTLPEGDYYLRERKSPAGFFGETARIRFSVTAGMTTEVEITSERDMEHTNPQDIIPKTGETLPLFPMGLSALCFSGAAACSFSLYRMKRKRQ
jgi:uncharacterized surface anchored protein